MIKQIGLVFLGGLLMLGVGCAGGNNNNVNKPAEVPPSPPQSLNTNAITPNTNAITPASITEKKAVTTPKPAVIQKTTSAAPSKPVSESYESALNKYRTSGGYFQLANCRSTPGTISIKRGVKFMIDNRDPVPHRIKVGDTAYQVAGYGFLIITPTTLGTNYLTCDGGGSGMVSVQQ